MDFTKEFKTLQYVIGRSKKILLFAHSRPDGDTVGSVVALKIYLKSIGKSVDIACLDPIPKYLENLFLEKFKDPSHIDLGSYDVIIAADSVERGFKKIRSNLSEDQVVVIIDHHSSTTMDGDIKMNDPSASSVCEMIYNFFDFSNVKITPSIATALMTGIISDTGNFQHANTTAEVMDIASDLMRKGASVSKIINTTFSNKNISALKLWGKAFEKALVNPKNKMIASVLTQEDLDACNASNEDLGRVASILNTVPGTSFSLILSQQDGGIVKGSLRSEEYQGVDVSAIAHQFGGGGHKLASGFEVKGKIIETKYGWEII